jgi:hypothetical protein
MTGASAMARTAVVTSASRRTWLGSIASAQLISGSMRWEANR